jgi:uncharacterized protein YodC (DUF2158 family)
MKIGDTVSLNSGGHLMTVAAIDSDTVTCEWSVKGDIKTKKFLVSMLKEASEPATLEQLVSASYERGSKSP